MTSPTDNKANTIAYEAIARKGVLAQIWQKIRLSTGHLVEHKIIAGSGNTPATVLLNVNSLAKRLGISKERLQKATASPSSKSSLLTTQTNVASSKKGTADPLKTIFAKNFELANQIAATHAEDVSLSELKDHDIATFGWEADDKLGSGSAGDVTTAKLRVTIGSTVTTAKKVTFLPLPQLVLKVPQDNNVDLTVEQKGLKAINPDGTEVGLQRPAYEISFTINGKKYTRLLMARYDGDLHKSKNEFKIEQKHKQPLIRQLLTGLATVHAKGFFHGDLKPQNTLVKDLDTDNPTFHIADFGGVKNAEKQKETFQKAQKEFKKLETEKATLKEERKKFDPNSYEYAHCTQKIFELEANQWVTIFRAKLPCTLSNDPDGSVDELLKQASSLLSYLNRLTTNIDKSEKERENLDSESPEYKLLTASINSAKELLQRSQSNMDKSIVTLQKRAASSLEYHAIAHNQSETWVQARKGADLFAMGAEITEIFDSSSLNLQEKIILGEMSNGKITAGAALGQLEGLWKAKA